MNILLISNSGKPFLNSYKQHISDFLESNRKVAFVTAARLGDENAYFLFARDALEAPLPDGAGLELIHLRWDANPLDILENADALFVGGGNTYVLQKRLKESGLMELIRSRVMQGMFYIGSSGGANVAGPNILTTNDWNVIGCTDFKSLGLVPFNINPHYLEIDPRAAPTSETRDDRIREYHAIRENPVIGIEEETLIKIKDNTVTVIGSGRIKLFRRDQEPHWYSVGECLDYSLLT